MDNNNTTMMVIISHDDDDDDVVGSLLLLLSGEGCVVYQKGKLKKQDGGRDSDDNMTCQSQFNSICLCYS